VAVVTHGVHSHGFLDDASQVGQLVQVSIVRAPWEGLVRHSQQPMLPQLICNLLLHLRTHSACVDKQVMAHMMKPSGACKNDWHMRKTVLHGMRRSQTALTHHQQAHHTVQLQQQNSNDSCDESSCG